MPEYSGETKEFGAKVPIEEYERFRETFPQYGASTWFITESLRRFNEEVERDPTAIEKVQSAIEGMVQRNRDRREGRDTATS